MAICSSGTFKGGQTRNVTTTQLHKSREYLIKAAQATMDIKTGRKGRYHQLKPVQNEKGIWVVGDRMCIDSPLQLLPTQHPLTSLLMREAHTNGGHRGRDATLARFRNTYWTPQGSKVAKRVKMDCQLCKLRDPKLMSQEMGRLPEERLTPSPPFTHVSLDLFSPFMIRGEVQQRTSGKAYGVIFSDLASRAIHIEPVFGYDTSSFILALRRFTALRGWPSKIYSDPGSQLTLAEKEVQKTWQSIDRERLMKTSTDNNLQWIFGPADSSWYQGTAESLIKSVKRSLLFSIGTQRVSPTEFLTLCTEAANMVNERPLGTMPSDDSVIKFLTPNSLLLGRSLSSSIGDGSPFTDSLKSRASLVSDLSQRFWTKWTELYIPTLIKQSKWQTRSENLKEGDIVLIADSNALKCQYHIAQVLQTFPDKRGVVRRVSLRYKTSKVGEKVRKYSGSSDIVVTRSVHRLAPLVSLS